MFREIDAECYLMIDGDDTYPLDCAQEMVDRVLQHQADMVVGDRLSSTYFTENKRPFHNFGNSLMRAGINSLFHANIKDIMTGYRAFSYEFVKTFPVFSKGFEIETEMTIHAVNYNMQVENVVVEYRDRPQGSESKLNTYSDGFRVIRKMMQLYKNSSRCTFSDAGPVIDRCFRDPVRTGLPGISEYRSGTQIPDTDRLWLYPAGGIQSFLPV